MFWAQCHGHTPCRLDHCKDISERRIVDKTLRSCALTCRALLPRSQVVLYWCIHIDDVESEVDAGGELGQCRRPREALKRLALALSTYPHLAPLIKTITACDGMYGWNGREDPVSNTFPIILARVRLPNLTAVRLVSGFWRGDLWRDVMVVSPAYLGTLSRLSGLGHLELSAVMFENFASFRRILMVLPRLSSLFLRNIQFRTGWSSPHLTTMPGQSKLPRITRLKLQLPNFEGSSSSCWVYVLLVRLAPSLERLTLVTQYSLMMTCTDPDSPSGCIAFPNLTSVTVRILQGGAAVVLPFFRDTTDLVKLRHITIDVGCTPRGAPPYEDMLVERAILDQSVLPCLERVTIAQLVGEFEGRSEDSLGECVGRWEAQMPVLFENSRRRFPGLDEKGYLVAILAVRLRKGLSESDDLRIWTMSPQGEVSSSDVIGAGFEEAIIGGFDPDLYWIP